MKDTVGTGQAVHWRSLTFQLLAIVVFPLIVLLLIITFGSTILHQNAMRQLVGDRDVRAARMVSSAIEDQVQRRANEVRILAGQVTGTSAVQGSAAIQRAAYLKDDFTLGIAVLGLDGRVIAVDGEPAFWQSQTALVTEGIEALAKDPRGGVYITKAAVLAHGQGNFMLVIASSADNRSVIAGAFSLDPLMAHVFANVFALNQQTSVVVVSPSGDVLYQKGFIARAGAINQTAGVAEALSGKSGTVYYNARGTEQVAAYSPVQPYGWALVIEEPWAQDASPLLETTHLAPLVLVPVLLLALLAVFFGIRQIVQPLQALATQASQLGWGDYGAIEKPVGGVSEIRQLQNELVRMAQKLRAAQQSLHSYIGAITSGQEEERRRLARDLHDDTIQSLIAFKQRVQLVEMDWENHPVAKALSELEGVAEQTIENLRRMVGALRPIYLEDLGLVAAIEMLTADTGKMLSSGVAFHRQGKVRRLEAPIELALYRMVQEALSNITRHAEASHAVVQLIFEPEAVRITIEDNGKGFVAPGSLAEFAPSGHFGLLGMFERAELIGGEIRIYSTPGKGTYLTITALYAPLSVIETVGETPQSPVRD